MPKNLTRFLASGFGVGLLPLAPGTFGTLAALPLAWAWSHLDPTVSLIALLLSMPLLAALCGRAAREAGAEDPAWIVVDEIAGFLVATLWLAPEPLNYAVAFFFFRLFDILKPPPVGWLDRSGFGGWSILLDDIAAGALTRAAIYLLAASGLV